MEYEIDMYNNLISFLENKKNKLLNLNDKRYEIYEDLIITLYENLWKLIESHYTDNVK